MIGGNASARLPALLAVALLTAVGLASQPARALEQKDFNGWWLAIDEAFPKLWAKHTIAPMEELVQINPDGRVTDRAMNFTAGTNQVCMDTKVCSDIPQIAVARIYIIGNRISFLQTTPATARLDTVAADAVIRREAITATRDWTVAIDGDRMTMKSGAKTRTLARIDLDRLRRLHAGMRASTFPVADHWRCFLGNATASEKAFAPLHAGKSYATPEFLERYLKFASYLGAIRSSIAIPAIDETNEQRRELLSVETEELMVQNFEGVLRPPAVEERRRLSAILTYVEQHTRTMIAYNAAAATAAQVKSVADAAAADATKMLAAAKAASAAAASAAATAKSAVADKERADAAATAQAQVVKDTASAARDADADAKSKDGVSFAAAASHDSAARTALAQRQKADSAGRTAADRQQKLDAARRNTADMQQQAESAKVAVAQQQQKLETAKLNVAALQGTYDTAKAAADAQQHDYDGARLAADTQQSKSARTAAAAREYSDALAALQKAFDDTTTLLNQTGDAAQRFNEADADGAPEAARDITEAADTLKAALKVTTAALKLAMATRERATAGAETAAARAAELTAVADAAQKRATVATDTAKAAASVRDQAQATADTDDREASRLAEVARDAETRAADAVTATTAAEGARDKSKADAEADTAEAARLAALADTAAQKARDALDIAKAAASARDKANATAEAATRESARRVDAVQAAIKTVASTDTAAKAAADKERQAKAQSDAAAQVFAKANAASQAAAAIASNANTVMQAAAATQPRSENLTPITAADIAAYAHVVDNSEAANKLFCGGGSRSGALDAPAPTTTVAAATPTAADDGGEHKLVTVPLPVARPAKLRN